MKLAAVILLIPIFLSGCTSDDTLLNQVVEMRKQVLNAEVCAFHTVITANYEDVVYTFQMDCTSDSSGNVQFMVTDPESIAGISGSISNHSAALTFDDKVLAFPMLADDRLTPVSAPWIFVNTLRSGYLTGYSNEDDVLCIYIDDSYNEYPLHLVIWTDESLHPVRAEIIWQERCVLALDVQNFTIQ